MIKNNFMRLDAPKTFLSTEAVSRVETMTILNAYLMIPNNVLRNESPPNFLFKEFSKIIRYIISQFL